MLAMDWQLHAKTLAKWLLFFHVKDFPSIFQFGLFVVLGFSIHFNLEDRLNWPIV